MKHYTTAFKARVLQRLVGPRARLRQPTRRSATLTQGRFVSQPRATQGRTSDTDLWETTRRVAFPLAM
jgi:hypothetical protein